MQSCWNGNKKHVMAAPLPWPDRDIHMWFHPFPGFLWTSDNPWTVTSGGTKSMDWKASFAWHLITAWTKDTESVT